MMLPNDSAHRREHLRRAGLDRTLGHLRAWADMNAGEWVDMTKAQVVQVLGELDRLRAIETAAAALIDADETDESCCDCLDAQFEVLARALGRPVG